jgi:beta-glucosidase
MTVLKTAGQAPMYYNHNNTGRPNTGTETLLEDIPIAAGQTSLGCTSYYLDSGYGPLFPFGYGLSYSSFEYSNITLDKSRYSSGDTIVVGFDLRNTGDYDATEVAQLYVRDLVGSVARPVKELKRFERITLKSGETAHVQFELPVRELAFWNADMNFEVEKGDFQLWVAGNSAEGEPVNFTVE